MPTLNITLPISDITMAGKTIEDFKDRMNRAVSMAIRTATRSSEARIRAITPVSGRPWERMPGQLQQSLHVWESLNEIRAEWTAPYAQYVDEGTPAHVVTGNMHWQPGPGQWAHSQGHVVRGIQPHRLKEQAAQIMREELELALFTLILAEAGGIG